MNFYMNFYHKLLDLPETETPPDHYGLLGVPRFTDDAKQIHAALVTRNTQLRGWDNSKFYREANALLDEVVAAAAILEDPVRKADYDVELRLRLGLSETKPVAVATPAKVVEEPTAADSFWDPAEEQTETKAEDPESNFRGCFLFLGGGLLAVATIHSMPTSILRPLVMLGGGLIAVSLLIIVTLLIAQMWPGTNPATTTPTTPNHNSAGSPPPLTNAPFGQGQAKQH